MNISSRPCIRFAMVVIAGLFLCADLTEAAPAVGNGPSSGQIMFVKRVFPRLHKRRHRHRRRHHHKKAAIPQKHL